MCLSSPSIPAPQNVEPPASPAPPAPPPEPLTVGRRRQNASLASQFRRPQRSALNIPGSSPQQGAGLRVGSR